MAINVDNFKTGIVRSVSDNLDGERIKVALVESAEETQSIDNIPWCYPLLPMLIHVKPKINEKVLVFFDEDKNTHSDRYYLGPINSQIDKLNGETLSALNTRVNSGVIPSTIPSNFASTTGCFAGNDEVALYGRKNSEIVMGDDYTSLRCDARHYCPVDGNIEPENAFNNLDPAYLTLHAGDKQSTATLVANKINLLGNYGDTGVPSDEEKCSMISETKMSELIQKAHQLPYGDILIDFMQEFVKAFVNHVHGFPGEAPDPSHEIQQLQDDADNLKATALSDSVRIN